MRPVFILALLALVGGINADRTSNPRLRHFVPDCRIILFGEVLDQVPSDDGKTLGTLIERTDDAVLINGRVWVSKDQKPRTLARPDEEIHRRGLVLEEAARQFREQHRKLGSTSYAVGDQVYTETPHPFHVDKYDETVDVAVKPGVCGMEYVYVTYEGTAVGFPLYPVPAPSKKEQEERRLNNAYRAAVNYTRSGTIVLVTHGGSFTPYPMERADALLAALAKIPALAVPVAENPYGEMVYRMLKVDGFTFGPDVVATFAERKKGPE